MKLTALALLLAIPLSYANQGGAATAQSPAKPRSAKDVLEAAQKKAAETNRNVFVKFEASWCGWCHKFTDSLKRPEVKKIIDKYYVLTPLVVMESKDKKDLENEGSDKVLKDSGGDGEGIPYFYIADKNGKMLMNSKTDPEKKGTNIGCPYGAEERATFKKILKSTSKITDEEWKVVEKALKEDAEKVGIKD
jgi:thioredoxin-related protein